MMSELQGESAEDVLTSSYRDEKAIYIVKSVRGASSPLSVFLSIPFYVGNPQPETNGKRETKQKPSYLGLGPPSALS